jgi:hypothetical protein
VELFRRVQDEDNFKRAILLLQGISAADQPKSEPALNTANIPAEVTDKLSSEIPVGDGPVQP